MLTHRYDKQTANYARGYTLTLRCSDAVVQTNIRHTPKRDVASNCTSLQKLAANHQGPKNKGRKCSSRLHHHPKSQGCCCVRHNRCWSFQVHSLGRCCTMGCPSASRRGVVRRRILDPCP